MRSALLLTMSIACVACGAQNDYAGAGITAGMAVAAAGVYRGATDGCWADCGPGFQCDEPSGTCVAAPCNAKCRADYQCMWVEGQQKCVLPPREGVGQLEPVEGGRKSERGENNTALCLAFGILGCAERPHALAADDSEADEAPDVISGGETP